MPPRLLVLVYPAGQDTVPITQPGVWAGVGCATCDRVIDDDPIVFSVDGETRCNLCLESRPQTGGCVWCGRRPARIQDTGLRFCQPCWTIYVAYVSDEVEPPGSPFRQLVADVYAITRKEAPRAEPVILDGEVIDYTVPLPDPPEGEDRPSRARGPGAELGAGQ